ncbi:hypothetical protein GCM10011575_08480 [Microlunatus endophyticus]|uniref:Polysaccharide pyruvyl transferase domain-containing protein n=1 Tax=Microlunatus endophyticus TaxID=1716077 RepID=A0A917S3C0_9ACTN|nr:hypothetical protein [Microlunatus endophyticus]GGL52425.1 hypothetical protein GCM10011575_08480 [Microlunatus endophyticus]
MPAQPTTGQPTTGQHRTASGVSVRAADAWVSALSNLVAVRSPLSGQLAERLTIRQDLSRAQRVRLDRLVPWARQLAEPAPVPRLRSGEIPFAVLGYRTPDYEAASRNIGDWVQTIAMMSHVIRRPDVRFTGDDEVAGLFNRLRSRMPAGSRIDGPSGTLRLVEVNRDASWYDSLPEPTWAFVFGWYFKLPFGRHPEFWLNPRIIPIFLSFHISRGDQLSDKAYDYLREHAPIGCRDWPTVRILRGRGIPAYFSGCVTTTIGSLFPPVHPDRTKPVAYVDVEPPQDAAGVVALRSLDNALRELPLAESLGRAVRRQYAYRSRYSRIVTSRLHTLLPALSCGLSVDWRPRDPNDRRFEGLAGPTAEPMDEMAARVSGIARVVLDAILTGRSKSEVYARYRDEVAEEVAVAELRLSAEEQSRQPFGRPAAGL